MIKTNVGDLWDKKLDDLDTTGYRLYVIRDGETVFYVGQSKEVLVRLLDHLGQRDQEQVTSTLNRFVNNNLPEAGAWQVELMTVADCGPLVKDHFPAYKRWGVDLAEIALMREFHPCFNTLHNPRSSQIPDKYRWDRVKRDNFSARIFERLGVE